MGESVEASETGKRERQVRARVHSPGSVHCEDSRERGGRACTAPRAVIGHDASRDRVEISWNHDGGSEGRTALLPCIAVLSG